MFSTQALSIPVLSVGPCLGATFGTLVTHSSPIADLVADEARKRLYVVDTNANAVEVYATNVSPPAGGSPGAHINGNAMPVTVKIGGVSSSTTGATTLNGLG